MSKDCKKMKPDRPLTSPAFTEVAGSSSTSSGLGSSGYVWCDIEPLARAGEYTYFNPPSAFRDSMFAERKSGSRKSKIKPCKQL